MICFPNAKINLGLHIINKREDGFHNIETVFYPVNCCDMLEVVVSSTILGQSNKVEFFSDGLKIEGDIHDNLIVKAYHLLDADFNFPAVQFFLYKNIPMGAGLGGGSSDAAFAIKLLNDKFELNLSISQMQNYASQLGSDCAFFIENKAAYAFGRGSELENFNLDLSNYVIALIAPPIHSNTALAYKNVFKRGELKEDYSLKKLLQQPIENWKQIIENDFEKTVFETIPQLPIIKQQLYDCGALYASMSGSGSCMFGIFNHQPKLTNELNEWVVYSGKL
jgi:4-diphosphocytidyl-2-C-methyl-D-erythritol kinase